MGIKDSGHNQFILVQNKRKKRVRIMGGTEKDSLLRVFIMMYLKHNSKSFVSIKERVGLV